LLWHFHYLSITHPSHLTTPSLSPRKLTLHTHTLTPHHSFTLTTHINPPHSHTHHTTHPSTHTLHPLHTLTVSVNYPVAAAEILDILNQQVALLTGGRDRQGQSLITFPAKPKTFTYNRDDVRKVVQYLTSIPTLVALCRMCLSGWGLESHMTSLISILLVVVCHMPLSGCG